MEISILISHLTWIPWKMLNSPPRSAILPDFLNPEKQEEEEEEEEEHKQLESVLRFTQRQRDRKATCRVTSKSSKYQSSFF